MIVKTRYYSTLIGIFCLTMFLLGCGNQKAEVPQSTPPVVKSPSTTTQLVEWKSDGTISENEYSKQQKIGDIDVFTRINGDTVMIALRTKTTGYMSIGIGAEEKMKGADILMCSVKNGQVTLTEEYSPDQVGPHPAKQGSAPAISMVNGSYKEGIMIVEFTRKLNPGGPQDKPLIIGDNKIIWATSDSDITTKKHTQRGAGVLVL